MVDFDKGTIINPRRKYFDVKNKNASAEQIKWEFGMLWKADIIPFWFPKETLCPITLYELGSHLSRLNMNDIAAMPIHVPKIGIGTEKGYARADDVWLQSRLIAPEVEIFDSAQALLELGGWIRRQVRAAGSKSNLDSLQANINYSV